uniref:Uncharacterized protein n=1 Tax=mine drainage metagenome TaxID=410659 RepID=E6QIS0_9ZZZZ
MAWDVEVSDEFKQWYERLNLVEQESIAVGVMLLEAYGPALGRPPGRYASWRRVPKHEGIAHPARGPAISHTVRV